MLGLWDMRTGLQRHGPVPQQQHCQVCLGHSKHQWYKATLGPGDIHLLLSPEPTAAPSHVSARSLSSSEIQVTWSPAPWKASNGHLLGYEVIVWLLLCEFLSVCVILHV